MLPSKEKHGYILEEHCDYLGVALLPRNAALCQEILQFFLTVGTNLFHFTNFILNQPH